MRPMDWHVTVGMGCDRWPGMQPMGLDPTDWVVSDCWHGIESFPCHPNVGLELCSRLAISRLAWDLVAPLRSHRWPGILSPPCGPTVCLRSHP